VRAARVFIWPKAAGYLTGVYLTGVHLIGVYLMGVYLMDVYFRFSKIVVVLEIFDVALTSLLPAVGAPCF
jgi:hypothetical protein